MTTPMPTTSSAATKREKHKPLAVVPVDQWVEKTRRLLLQERDEEIAGVQSELAARSDADNPNVLTHLRLVHSSTALFGRRLLRLELPSLHLQRAKPHQFTVGDLVQVRMGKQQASPAAGPLPTGIVAKVEDTAISVALSDGDSSDEHEDAMRAQPVTLDRLVNNATFTKISSALDRMAKHDNGAGQRVVDIVFAGTTPRWNPLKELTPFNPGLNDSQCEAIRFALASTDLALIHGPPGTGKTTTIVELILQAVRRYDMKVLVCAPSNVAVDNVLEKTAAAASSATGATSCDGKTTHRPLQLIRIGHPARLSPQILPYCLDACIARAEGTEIVNDVRKEMQQMEQRLGKTKDKSVRYQLRRELRANRKEIRQREQNVVKQLLAHSDVVFATNVGAASKLLQDVSFDVVIIDEAAQALEASCWIPMRKASRCVLAGDHLQLPPTIKSKAAAAKGLELTLFDRVTRLPHTQDVVRMLTTQYRMHEDISSWSSQAMYDGALQSFAGVAARKMHQLPHVQIPVDDSLRNATLLLLDTAGCDLEEDEAAASSKGDTSSVVTLSKGNEGEVRVVVKHVRALLQSGLRPDEVAVITPYNKQVQLLKAALVDEFPTLEIRSVDGFQGCEKEAVVMSLVRSNARREVGFLADERRMNVAITRAKRHVAVVCDTETISSHKFLKQLVQHFEERGEYRSAQEYLDEDVVVVEGGSSDMISSAVAAIASVKVEEKVTVTTPVGSTRPQESKRTKAVAPQDSKKSVKVESKTVGGASSAGSAAEVATVEARAKQEETASVEAKQEEEAPDSDDDDDDEAVVGKLEQKSAFLLLDDSPSSSDSDSSPDKEEDSVDPTAQDPNSIGASNALLRDLHQSRLARQPIPPPAPTTASSSSTNKKGKKGKAKRKKTKKSTAPPAGGGGITAPIADRADDEDDLTFLTKQAEQSSRCGFQGIGKPRCKKNTSLLGAICKCCKLKFCFDHAQPEVHGCGDAIRQLERQQFHEQATRPTSDGRAKKLSAEKRKLLHKKLESTVNEKSASRQTKATPKK